MAARPRRTSGVATMDARSSPSLASSARAMTRLATPIAVDVNVDLPPEGV
jgi:hypothetical protein